ncbi:DUF4233 domain-containing protein [Cumulibacter manganitolerans]|uniref:DUF4233 domain-containing protein n=1 Tax=Cumulibacter manganitolerans TaxID=1884992 RepID=UPI0012960AD4|nr:DUF4233 domain-containing protein [Cumulibacter manganitolerans]
MTEPDAERRGLPPVDKDKLARSMRGIYSALLILEAIVVLMVPATIRQFGVGLTGFRLTAIIVIVAALIALCAFIKKPWAVAAGWVLQAAVVLMGFWVWAMWPLGLAFAAMWWYAGRLHKQLLARPDA